jgi:hypothetical protein
MWSVHLQHSYCCLMSLLHFMGFLYEIFTMLIILGRSFEVSAYTPEVTGLEPNIIFELVHRTRFLKLRIACSVLYSVESVKKSSRKMLERRLPSTTDGHFHSARPLTFSILDSKIRGLVTLAPLV